MEVCALCGHELGIGRFCTNCGHPVGAAVPEGTLVGPGTIPAGEPLPDQVDDWRTDTAERPREVARDITPPPVTGAPEPARFPLYADEPTSVRLPRVTDDDPDPAAAPTGEEPDAPRHVDESRRRGAAAAWAPWVVGLTVLLLVAGLGLWLLLSGDDGPTTATDPVDDPVRTERPSRDSRTPEGRATVSPAPRAEPGDLAAAATVTAPKPAPAGQDVGGGRVSFVAANLLDGDPETCWRMPGDGTGESITFGFDGPTEVTEVGLVNGYAKTATDGATTFDWYAGNRRTLRVEWTFDDGTIVTQRLRQARELQTTTLDEGVVTEQVTLRLLDVSSPGSGRASRDYTAISEVSLRGVAGS